MGDEERDQIDPRKSVISSYRGLHVWQQAMDLKELETHILLSQHVELITGQDAKPMLEKSEVVGKMLRALIRSLQNRGKA